MTPEARRPAVVAGGALAMGFVGGSVAVSGQLASAPLWTVQAIRYGIGCVLLLGLCRLRRIPVRRPSGVQWCFLSGVTLMGLVLFNVGLVAGGGHAEPAVLGVAIACVPVILAVFGPLLERSSARGRAVVAAVVVTTVAALVQGFGHSDLIGFAYALLVFVCEASFTLLAVPLLAEHGAYGVSVHTTWMAAVAFGALGVLLDGPGAALHLTAGDWAAIGYLAALVTAAAFVLWYGCVGTLGAAHAGLLAGIAPAAAALIGTVLGRPIPGIGVWLGIAIVAAGLVIGLRPARSPVAENEPAALDPTAGEPAVLDQPKSPFIET
jgi:drug/metabolite transporter (DMT)-like permease